MAMVFGTHIIERTNYELVAAVTGKIIRILRLVVTGWSDTKITLISDPGGMNPANITPALHFCINHELDLRLGRGLAITAERGRSLGMTTAFRVSGAEYSVALWYELVS